MNINNFHNSEDLNIFNKAKNFILFNGTIATKGSPGEKYSESLAAGVAPIEDKKGPYACLL